MITDAFLEIHNALKRCARAAPTSQVGKRISNPQLLREVAPPNAGYFAGLDRVKYDAQIVGKLRPWLPDEDDATYILYDDGDVIVAELREEENDNA